MTAIDPKVWFSELARAFEAERDHLGELDAKVGDGDHGASMARGFAKAQEAAAASREAPGPVLTVAGQAFMKGVGGASGPLFATLFLELGKSATERGALDLAAIRDGSRHASQRIQRLGHCNPGDKTMLDALVPASDAIAQALDQRLTLAQAVEQAASAAQDGADATKTMTARKGRARFIEGQGVGQPDPGAVSMSLVFRALAMVAAGKDA